MPRADDSVASVLGALSAAFRRLGVSWYVFGAQALVLRGLPRATADVDVTVMLGELPTERLAAALERSGFKLRAASSEFIAATRVLPIVHVRSRLPVDVVLGGPGLEERFAAAAERIRVGRTTVPVARSADLVLMKVLSARPKDLEDAVALLCSEPRLASDAEIEAVALELSAAIGEDDVVRNLAEVRARASKGSSARFCRPLPRRPKR
jgi:hypothetical protein